MNKIMKTDSLLNLVLILIMVLSFSGTVAGQSVSISPGKTNIPLNGVFELNVTIKNDELKSYENFPDIKGFVKTGTSSGQRMSIINGQKYIENTVTQRYKPKREGNYSLKPFSMSVNGKPVKFPQAVTIQVGPPVKRNYRDPFADFFNNMRGDEQDNSDKFRDVRANAFFGVSVDKSDVYVGEGFNITMAFYIADNNEAEMNFYKPGEQLSEIKSTILPKAAFEENFDIDQIIPERVKINGKNYTQYKIYQGTFYPFSEGEIVIPSAGLKMIKYKVSNRRTLFGRRRKEDYQTFRSSEKRVRVKPLPPHPLREKVAVGNYKLREGADKEALNTGESLSYRFSITGQGNISSINPPEIPESDNFDFYPPDTQQDVRRNYSAVYGSKEFTYSIIPNEPGKYDMGEYFSWIFFNTETEKYDTLKSELQLAVGGESLKNEKISSGDLGGFYRNIPGASNELNSMSSRNIWPYVLNFGVAVLLGTLFFFFFTKRKEEKKKERGGR